MESEKKILGKKRKGDKILIEQLDKDSQDNEIIKPDNKIINEDSKIINKSTENLNLNPNNMKNNALSLNDIKNNSAFVNKIEQAIPLNFNNNIINNPKINPNFMLGKNMSFQNDTQSDQIIYPTPISNPQPNKTIPKKINQQISTYSDNSESSSQSQEDSPKNSGQKVKSHLQSSRNTAFGLKEISKRVMDIIKQSGTTTYKAISDQIVNEINEKSSKDEKNIRRRIYDSLNVMKSMKLFRRDKNSKNILWNYDQELDPLNENENKNDFNEKNKIDSGDIATLKKEIKEKRNKLDLLKMELIGLKNVLERNARENNKVPEDQKLYFPFIVIEFPANKDPKINVALNDNKTKAHFGFDEVISMYGDLDAVSKIGNHPNFSKSN
jgi:hypothetical protein